MKGLKSAKGFLRSQLASRLNLRYMPDLDLRYDSLLTESMKIDALIAKGLNKKQSVDTKRSTSYRKIRGIFIYSD